MIWVQMIYNDFKYETGFHEPTMISNTTSNGFTNQHNWCNFLSTVQGFLEPTQLMQFTYSTTTSISELSNCSEKQRFVSSMLNKPIALSAILISNVREFHSPYKSNSRFASYI